MSRSREFRLRRGLLAGGIGVGASALAAGALYRLGEPPDGPKPCRFSYPREDGATAIPSVEPPFAMTQRAGTINDASCLNRTPVLGVVAPASVEDLRRVLSYARANRIKTTAAGARHSMGGQSFSRGGLVIDMRRFDKVSVDPDEKTVTVGPGAIWHNVLTYLDARRLSVKAMQSISVFTVGGTLSVNAHGVAHDPGCVAATVRSLRVMLANGTVVDASRDENSELFRYALGGYGLFGIILDARLEITENELYAPGVDYIDYHELSDYFAREVEHAPEVRLFYGRLSVSPLSWLRLAAVHTYRRIGGADQCPPLEPDRHARLERTVFNLSKTGSFGRLIRWTAERRLDSMMQCRSRNVAMGHDPACAISRNEEIDDEMPYLENRLDDTDILQEYFIPRDRFVEFVDGLRRVVAHERANLLNVTIRSVERDDITALPYAPRDAFAVVLYFNQALDLPACKTIERTTRALIDLAIPLGGRFYLPYQLYYSAAQLRAAYPEVHAFFAAKRRYDPDGVLSNTFYEKYGDT